MTPAEVVAAFRDEVVDTAEPYGWSDNALYRYLNEAQNKFCQWGIGITDVSTEGVCVVDIAAGEEFASLSPKILTIKKAYLVSTGRELSLTNIETATARDAGDEYFPSGVFRMDTTSGPVHGLILGLERNKLRWNRIPAINDRARLAVVRLPLKAIDATSTRLEIDEQYHEGLLLWMKKRAFDKVDAETGSFDKSAAYEQAFRAWCEQCRLEGQRREHVPREVVYGGL
jgi:hypothetical protein